MKKLISYLVILLLVFSLISCGKVQEQPGDGGGDIDNPIVNPGGSDNPVKPPVEDKVKFSVSLLYNKKTYIPAKNEEIKVVWADDYQQHTATIKSDGYAEIELDGDFNVYLNIF